MLLHILNGDSTFQIIQGLDIPGDFAIWREIMCEGPVSGDLQTEVFWEKRTEFITSFFQSEPGEYGRKMMPELAKMREAAKYDEVILWFEYDLFCQINMLAALQFLRHLSDQPKKISLICVGDWPGYDQKLTLGEIEPKHYYQLLETRRVLDAAALDFADKAWQVYAGPEAETLNDDHLFIHPAFPYLAGAIRLHKRRFPSRVNGLNRIERQLLENIKAGEKDERKLIGDNLRQFRDEGFGDLQHLAYLKHLSDLFSKQEGLQLNDQGLKILAGEDRFTSPIDYLGGAERAAYYWDKDKICTAAT